MNWSYRISHPPHIRAVYVLDFKQGDVNGDGVPDNVYLTGNKTDGPSGIFADNITLLIQNGISNTTISVTPKFNAGYNARLFLGDFTMDNISDIKIDIDSGGSGGYIFSYIYAFENNNLEEIFDFEKYNNEYRYRVDYKNFYKVDVANVSLDALMTFDISYKGYDYLSRYYNENGSLKKPVDGEVLSIGGLFPIVTDERTNNFDLLAVQRVIGTSNADTLGYVVNLLKWNGFKFVVTRTWSATDARKLITPY